jgi:hypothetical protein
MFDIIFLKKTGQIVRAGYFGDALVLAKDEDNLSFDGWVEFHSKAVNVKTRTLVDSNTKNAFSFRGVLGTIESPQSSEAQLVEMWTPVRQKRDNLLNASDYLMMPDYPISDGHRVNLTVYRQSLRDVTKQSDPENIIWPDFPIE